MTQTEAIARHLKSGQSITQEEARKLFRCWRLAARIKDLRDRGYEIVTQRVKRKYQGETKTFARYVLL